MEQGHIFAIVALHFRHRLSRHYLAAIKTATYFDVGAQDVILTVFTDSTDLYQSRLEELRQEWAPTGAKCKPDYWRALFEDEVAYFDQLILDFNKQAQAKA